MILQHLQKLKNKRIVLASSSPRRKEILDRLGLNLSIIPSTFEENLDIKSFNHPGEYVIATAQGKADEVASRLSASKDHTMPDLIIGADTCVTLDGEVFGKPKDKNDANITLSRLSGRSHDVLTGVCLKLRAADGTWSDTTFYETTSVKFGKLSPELITAYIDTGEPMDKAGGYGIQGLGGTLVESLNGDYYNVMGFPLHQFSKQLDLLIIKFTTTTLS